MKGRVQVSDLLMVTKTIEHDFTVLTSHAPDIVASVFKQDRRVLLLGAPGVGKSTLATQLAEVFAKARRPRWCLSADPGSPLLGVPGGGIAGPMAAGGLAT